MPMRPLSARNPRIRRLTKLVRRPGERAEQRALVVEGPTLLGEAIERGVPILEVYVDADRVDDDRITALLDLVPDVARPVWIVPAGSLDRIGDAASSQGILAVVRNRELEPRPDRFVLVLDHIADPGNAGTLIRAAAAAGAGAVSSIGGADLSAPKVVRASAGTVLSMPMLRYETLSEAMHDLRERGFRLVGAVPRGGADHGSARLDDRSALILGNEAHGLDPGVIGGLDDRVTIEMAADAESLNVAMAGTVLCFEIVRRRGTTTPAG